eukprot:TRINITY_DN44023_c0_g1_i1.p1 TRINITY_DN44023_c0_g1~~TRINITY_DN44023_c0_g1_i1.p1  ORF type:complete len:203 (+),score=18.68 TRINITY_DN44023_c0_g1_i1:154-762(+)
MSGGWAAGVVDTDSDENEEFGFDYAKGVVWKGEGDRNADERRAAARRQFKYTEPDELFDPEADEDDEKWTEGVRKRDSGPSKSSAAVHLSCPCCFSTISLTAKSTFHIKHNIWDSSAPPLTCIISSPITDIPKKVQEAVALLPRKPVSDLRWWTDDNDAKNASLHPPQEYYSIQCGVCQVRVGVYSTACEHCVFDCVIPSDG